MRSSLPALVLACLATLLVAWPLTMQKPGLPVNLKSDEPAYYLAARSLWEDHDLRCEERDLARIYDEFLLDPDNLILMTKDGWHSVYYGKPYFNALLAAPLVGLFGANGFVAFNMACLLVAVLVGWLHLRRVNGSGESLLFAAGYFLVSAAFAYVFWLQPEVSNLAAMAVCLYFVFGPPPAPGSAAPAATGPWPRRLAGWARGDAARWVWAGLAAAPAINAKPAHLVVVLPGALLLLGRRRFRHLVLFGMATTIACFAIAAGQKALSGTWSPYLGVQRRGFNVRSPQQLPWADFIYTHSTSPDAAAAAARGEEIQAPPDLRRAGSWHWIFRFPDLEPSRFFVDFRNYWIGRHAGIFVFYPFLLVALALGVSGGALRDPARLTVLGSILLYALFFLIWDSFNYHGGGGFVGNRYFVGAYPLGLFLVGRLRPLLLTLLGFLLGGLFLGQILFAPLGPPVDEPTLQAYTRATTFRFLPYEFPNSNSIPGYRGMVQAGAYLRGRKDQVKFSGDWITVIGDAPVQIFYVRGEPVTSAVFLVRSYVPGNEVTMRLGGNRARLRFPDTPPPPGGAGQIALLEVGPPADSYQSWSGSPRELAWYLDVHARHAGRPSWWGGDTQEVVGARLVHLGTRDVLEQEVHPAAWTCLEGDRRAVAGGTYRFSAAFLNGSASDWTAWSPARVKLGYRWKTIAGASIGAEGRLELYLPVAPGAETAIEDEVPAPAAPGVYLLEVEPILEYVRWFAGVQPDARRELRVLVQPAATAALAR